MKKCLWVQAHGHSTGSYGKVVGGRGARTPGRRIYKRIGTVSLGGHVAPDLVRFPSRLS
jgi:hypothetical protein